MRMIVVGLTGGLGTGKSTVAKMLEEFGATVIDADEAAHDVIQPRKLAWRQILERFGEDLVHSRQDVRINRKKLAARVFGDPEALEALEAIVHPRVLREMQDRIDKLRKKSRSQRIQVVVLDVPLLFETNAQSMADTVVVVTAPPEIARARLLRRGLSAEDITQRQAAQWEVSAKAALADVVIDNAGSMERTRRQVEELWDQLVVNSRRRRRA